MGCLACCAYGLCWVVARPSMPGPSLFAPPGSSREELKIVKTCPSPLPPSPRAVSYTSSQALYGVCGMNVNYMDFSFLRTTINSLLPYFDSMAMVFNSSNLTNISSIQGIFRSGGVNSSLTQIYKTSAWPPTASSTTLQTKIGATWSKLVEDLGAGCGRWGWVAGVWLLVCCVLGAACWVLLRVLPCLPL